MARPQVTPLPLPTLSRWADKLDHPIERAWEYISMTKSSWNRTLDLGEPKSARKTKAKAVRPKALVTVGGLSLRQAQQHQKAIIAVSRWTSRLTRAANEVAKHTKTVKRYERLIAKNAPKEGL